MNILLVNNDAVIAKLVRLSTQKTGDRLDTAGSIDEVREESYDLLILDDGLFSRAFLEALNDKAIYAHSIFITTREREETALFEKQLYKPFLPTELLVLLHQFASSVKKEQEELSKEIVFDDFENSFFSEDEIVNDEDLSEQEALGTVHKFEKIREEVIEESSEEEPLENIFSEQEVTEVKAILDALNSDEESEEILVDEVIDLDPPMDDIDEELERALQNITKEELAQPMDSLFETSQEQSLPSRQNQESIETLQTLLKALENPQIAKSLRGTITINLTFGDD
jgi:uncharacterized membrane protein